MRVEARENPVIMLGFSDCFHRPLGGPSIWIARIRDGFVSDWRVYDDKDEVRQALRID